MYMSNVDKQLVSSTKIQNNEPVNLKHDLLSAIGYILGVSYPVLALSTGVRAIFQLFFKGDVTNYVAPSLSAVAAVCYLVAALGFLYRRRWTWYLSVGMLGFEMIMVLAVGALSVVYPDLIGRTVWHHFGVDYGFFPLFQPLLGLVWLFWPETIRSYGIRGRQQAMAND
jgi:hypothetical protein